MDNNAQKATVVADSMFNGKRLVTLKTRYWRAIHGEVMTHRKFMRNASSSRAIPVKTMLMQVINDPAGPLRWTKNKSGMQADEYLDPLAQLIADFLWYQVGAKFNAGLAYALNKLGVHKQHANRCLEPWQFIDVLISSTDYTNFMQLRDHSDAQPEMQDLARKMKEAIANSMPTVLAEGEWHLPFITQEERQKYSMGELIVLSTARNARISYGDFDGKPISVERDRATYAKLVGSSPMHYSPAEHPAEAIAGTWANYDNFKAHRHDLERGYTVDRRKQPRTYPVPEAVTKYPHYYVNVKGHDWVDIYELLELFKVTDHALGHAAKKILCSGVRGNKPAMQDIAEAHATLGRWLFGAENGHR